MLIDRIDNAIYNGLDWIMLIDRIDNAIYHGLDWIMQLSNDLLSTS